jgi:hypothetical protein
MPKIRCSTYYGKKLYKVLSKRGTSRNGGRFRWSLPQGERPGAWHKIPDHLAIEICQRGFHVTTSPRRWGGREWTASGQNGKRNENVVVYEVQVRGKRYSQPGRSHADKIAVREVRLLRVVPCP